MFSLHIVTFQSRVLNIERVGDLTYIENIGIPMLIINSYETCIELLNKRSAIYSSRHSSMMAHM